jgi:hypothetical protein
MNQGRTIGQDRPMSQGMGQGMGHGMREGMGQDGEGSTGQRRVMPGGMAARGMMEHGPMGGGMMDHGMMAHGLGRGGCSPIMSRIIFALMDGDGDGTVSLQEFEAAHERIFKAMDANKDGQLTEDEMMAFMHGVTRSAPQQ